MTHELPGNPHYSEDWGRGIDIGYHGDQAQSEVLAAQVDATLALAYEQRTANLIALWASPGNLPDGSYDKGMEMSGVNYGDLANQIKTRLGLGGHQVNQPPLNSDALEAARRVTVDAWMNGATFGEIAACAIGAYLEVTQPEVTSKVEAFINQRPEYIHALKNTRSGDDMSDYSRWNGHAESRRQLAQALGWTVPHNPGETTRPEVNDA